MLNPKAYIQSVGSESILFAHKADLLLDEDEVDQAVELCEEGVKRFPFYPEGYVQLARCYQLKEQYDQAVEAYQKALFDQPSHIRALKGLAYLYYKMRNKEAGESALLSAYLYDPFDEELYDFLNSEGLLTRIYISPMFEEEEETTTKESMTIDLDDILEDSRPTDEDERNNLLEEIDEHQRLGEEDLIDAPLTAEESSAIPSISEITEDSFLDAESTGGKEDVESDFFPETLAEVTPGLGAEQENSTAQSLEEESTANETDEHETSLNESEDFTNWMNDLFKADEQTDHGSSLMEEESPEIEEKKPEEQIQDELDTILIFADRRNSELPEAESAIEEEQSSEPPVADFNTLEEDIERISSSEAEEIEHRMVEPASEPPEPEQPESELAPVHQEQKREEHEADSDVDQVIKRLQEGSEKKQEASGDTRLRIEQLQSKSGDDEAVEIEDILNNPSLLTPTFGEILIAQHKFSDALKVFEALAEKDPENPRFKKKIEFLKKLVSAGK